MRDQPLLVASRCDGVLRVDGARRLLESKSGEKRKSENGNGNGSGDGNGNGNDNGDDFIASPGGTGLGCVLAEHLLDEIAYKIGRALKYGA